MVYAKTETFFVRIEFSKRLKAAGSIFLCLPFHKRILESKQRDGGDVAARYAPDDESVAEYGVDSCCADLHLVVGTGG